MTPLEQYAARFASLRVDRQGTRPRPHKAVMLLSVMALAESGRLVENRIEYSEELLEIFARFFALVRAGNDRCTPFNPFFHLRSDGFWHLHPQPGAAAILEQVVAVKGPSQLLELVSHVSIDQELLALLGDRQAREILRHTLVITFFPTRSDAVNALCNEEDLIAEARRSYVTAITRRRLHQQTFRQRVLRAYRQSCAICRLHHDELLEAAHILPDNHPFGEPTVPNGLALCKLHHAAFDRNILGIRPDLIVDIRLDILEEEDGPMLRHGLQGFQGSTILTPHPLPLKPNRDFLAERYQLFRKAG